MPRRPLRIAGVVAALLGLLGSVLGPSAAHATPADFVLPVAETFSRGQHPVGSVDGRLYVVDGQDGRLRSSADGLSWSVVPQVPAHADGRLIGDRYVVENDGESVTAYPLPTGEPIVRETTGYAEAVGFSGFIEDREDGSYFVDLETGASTRLVAPSRPTEGSYSRDWIIAESVAVRSLSVDLEDGLAEQTQLAVSPLDGTAGPLPVMVTGDPSVVVGLGKAWYAAITDGRLTLCSSPLTALSFSCEELTDAANIGSVYEVDLHVLRDQVLVSFSALDGGTYLLTPSGPIRLSFPAGTTFQFGRVGLQADGNRLLTIGTVAGAHAVFAVGVDGSTNRIATGPKIPAPPRAAVLGGDTMFVLDRRPSVLQNGGAVWRRSATAAGVGAETLLPIRATSVGASAGRLAMTESEREYVTWFDRGVQGRSIPGWLASNVSGPFAMVTPDPEADSRTRTLYRADGTKLGPTVPDTSYRPFSTLFGTKLATGVDNRVCVRDLLKPSSTAVCGPESPETGLEDASVWGDWIAWTDNQYGPDSDDVSTTVHAFNLKTKVHRQQVMTSYAYSLVLGDGVLMYERRSGDVLAWNFTGTATAQVLGQGTPLALDGTRAVWVDEDWAVHLSVLDDVEPSAPRLLGMVAPTSFARSTGSWTPQFDTTKAVAEGVLEIRSESTVVRTLRVPKTTDGSIRRVTWNGRNNAGALAAAGRYTWTLRMNAADGSGALTDLEGAAAPTGNVTVTGVLTAAVPKVTGKAVYAQKLRALTGAWGPAPVTLRFQWLRDGKPIGKAKDRTYTLKSADLGKRISVRVTGSKALHPTVIKTSAATSKVVRARLAATPRPKITGSVQVGSTLRTRVGAWKPSPVGLSYRWKRNGIAIAGATRSSYKATKADKGKRLTVSVTGRKTGYVAVTRTSVATAKVG